MADGITAGSQAIGIDLGDRFSQVCVLGHSGEPQEETRLTTRPEVFRQAFERRPRAKVALEAGTHSPWVSRLLSECGHEVFVANPSKLRMIYQNDSKSDRVDAQWLARVVRLDPQLLSPIVHRGLRAQADLAVIRARDVAVRARTQLVNHVRGAVKAYGGRLPICSTPSFSRKASGEIPEPLLQALEPTMDLIRSLSGQIRSYDRSIVQIAEQRYPEAAVVGQIQGVGALTALAFVLIIEDPGRFTKSRTVGAYLGLRPRQSQSGEQKPQLRITKAGDELLRRLMVQAAHYILGPKGPDTDLRRVGLAICARGGKSTKKRATIAVARKLAVLMHHLWITGEVYEPLRNTTLKEGMKSVVA